MQKLYSLIIVLLSLTFVPKAQASHIYGGEIRWECVDSGKFVFYLDVYVNCANNAASWNYQNTTLRVVGSPLPRDENNSFVSSIFMQADSNKWRNLNSGELAPACDANNPNQLACGDQGATRAYYYKSNPQRLKGTPPSGGWVFIYDPPCCRPNAENLLSPTSNTMDFRANMYAPTLNSNGDSCRYSTPKFDELPTNSFCREREYTFNHAAVMNGVVDSIVYAWDRSYNTYPTQPAVYDTSYNYDRPTPDTSFNPQNKVATINRNTGTIDFAVYNGNGVRSYLMVVRADAYQDGEVLSSVFREIPYIFFDCPPIDSVTPNNPPEFYFDNQQQANYEVLIEAGDTLELPVEVFDLDQPNPPSLHQELTLFPSGSQFSTDFADLNACPNPPCAILKDSVPQFDSSRMRFGISSDSAVYTVFEWQTSCNHINVDGTPKSYYFYFSAKDDHCPIPQQADAYVKVTVGAEGVVDGPIMECISQVSNGNEISWSAGQALSTNFNKWYIFAGDSVHHLQLIDSISNFNTQNYIDTAKHDFYQVKTNTSCGTTLGVLQSKLVQVGYQKNPILLSLTESNQVITADDSMANTYQWYDCNADSIIIDSTRRSFAPQFPGSYAAILTKGLCTDTTACIQITSVGLNENNFQNTVNFYPNPSSGLVNIEVAQKQESLQIKVRNIHGQVVQNENLKNQDSFQLQLKGEAGIYFIEIMNNKGERTNIKVIKK